MRKNRTGTLLIAHPNLPQENPFRRSVIYIHNETDEGTSGLVLNKNTGFPIKNICKERGILYPNGIDKVFAGGPVQQQALILLHTNEWVSANTKPCENGLAVSSDVTMFERLSLGQVPAYWRMFTGFCGWGQGQLDAELNGSFPYKPENSWLTAKANDDIIFKYEGEEQWQQAMKLSSRQMIDSFF